MNRKLIIMYIISSVISILAFIYLNLGTTVADVSQVFYGYSFENVSSPLVIVVFFQYIFFQGLFMLDWYEKYSNNFIEYIKYRSTSNRNIYLLSLKKTIKLTLIQSAFILAILTIIGSIIKKSSIDQQLICNYFYICVFIFLINSIQFINRWLFNIDYTVYLLIVALIATILFTLQLTSVLFILYFVLIIVFIIRRRIV